MTTLHDHSTAAATDQLSLRRATADDCLAFFMWNNARDVREVSLTTDSIPWQAHRSWFHRQLQRPATAMYAVEVNHIPAGNVRIERAIGESRALVSVTVAPTFRGLHVGRWAIREACERYSALHPLIPIEAWIRDDNHASQRCFKAAGFLEDRSLDRGGYRWNIHEFRSAEGDLL